MIKIILACSAGMSTSLLMNKMKSYAKEQKIEIDIDAIAEGLLANHINGADIILLGPQVKYLEKSISELVNKRCPVAVIDLQKYGLMDGKGVLEDALHLLKNKPTLESKPKPVNVIKPTKSTKPTNHKPQGFWTSVRKFIFGSK